MPSEGSRPSHRKVPAMTDTAFGPDGGPADLYIGGKWLPARDGRRFDVINPATGDALARVADAGVAAAMATRKIGPALAAGCTVVLKPASDTPLTALALARTLADAGVPAGVVNVVPGRRSGTIVAAMLHDGRVRKLSFTGSTEVGRLLLKEAADKVINTSMELGGNAPFLVFADADLDAAVDGAMVAKMRNAGEACTAANRFYAESGIAAEFGRRLAGRMAALTVGPGTDAATEVGPLVNAAAVDKVESLVAGALAAGARSLAGAGRPDRPGYYY